MPPRLWLLLAAFVVAAVSKHPYPEHQRYKRQLGDVTDAQRIDLNITVPYIFSARLYSYGPEKGDEELLDEEQSMHLQHPLHYLGHIYDTVHVRGDGSVSLSSRTPLPSALPAEVPLIAVYWRKQQGGRVFFRETTDDALLNLVHNEVNIQYRYGSEFKSNSVLLVTWEGVRAENEPSSAPGATYQLALVIGDTMTFAHIVYSKLDGGDAVAGFSSHSPSSSYSLPDSATRDAVLLAEKSDIGIPGEWLFRIDGDEVYLCGAGFKGLECIESCAATQWHNDCAKGCHCADGVACDKETGACPVDECSPGWMGRPRCDQDIDECSHPSACPSEQPDCLNTPGSFMCLCFEYDEVTGLCKGGESGESEETPARIPVGVMPLRPTFTRVTAPHPTPLHRQRFKATTTTVAPIPLPAAPTPPSHAPPPQIHAALPPAPVDKPIPLPRQQRPLEEESGECALCHQHATCHEQQCVCRAGYQGSGILCIDIDECAVVSASGSPCGAHATCTNTAGSYDCTCHAGFVLRDGRCVDIDECSAPSSPCPPAPGVECVNTPGAFECKCEDGYAGDALSGRCVDVDECAASELHCGPSAKCTNVPGGFECECHRGFERISSEAQCSDVDECLADPCHPAAVCTNMPGSYTCHCIEGFVGDGIDCAETILFPIANDSLTLARRNNAFATLELASPVVLFGKEYTQAHVSSNGAISFSTPLPPLLSLSALSRLGQPAILPLHAAFDYARQGLVAYNHINITDAPSYALLTRASLTVQDLFKLPYFSASHLHLFTYEHMLQSGSDHSASFQLVIACSHNATFAIFLYQQADTKGAIAGVAGPHGLAELPADQLVKRSNVGQPGKWLLRVDETETERCPGGASNAPYCEQSCPLGHFGASCALECHCAGGVPCDVSTGVCATGCAAGWKGTDCQTDIDECVSHVVSCGEHSECRNTRGGYECSCGRGFVKGERGKCRPIARCVSRFGRECHPLADCVGDDEPLCRCRSGYLGDGFGCKPAPVSTQPTRWVNSPVPVTDPGASIEDIGAPTTPTHVTPIETTPSDIPPTHLDFDFDFDEHLQPMEHHDHGSDMRGPLRAMEKEKVRQQHVISSSKPASSEENPFVMVEWTSTTPYTTTTTRRRPTAAPVPIARDYDVLESQLRDSQQRKNLPSSPVTPATSTPATHAATMLFLIAPAVLVIVWLVLIVIVVLLCCRRRAPQPYQNKGASEWMSPNRVVTNPRCPIPQQRTIMNSPYP